MKQPPSPSPAPRRRGADQSAEPGLADTVWGLMSGFVGSYDTAAELRQALGLGRGAGRVKALLRLAGGPLSLAELAQAIGSDPSYTTIIVNELQALGLLSRASDARDRRRKAVNLTAAGREATRKAHSIIDRAPSPLRDLPAADLLRLRDILSQLSRN